MKVLLVHKHFWPDTPPYATMLKVIARQLDSEGHEVTVLSAQPSYKSNTSKQKSKEQFGENGTIVRINLVSLFNKKVSNLINFIYFPLRVFLYLLLNRNFDTVSISTAPPVLGGFFTGLAAYLTNTKFIYHCMDIHPEIGQLSGEFSNPFIYKLLRKLDLLACSYASRVIVLSEDMKKSLQDRNEASCCAENIKIINNFALPSEQEITCANLTVNSLLKKNQKTFRVIFAGNIGRFQGLEDIVEAVRKLGKLPHFEFVFLGEGKALQSIKELAEALPDGMVKFFPQVDVEYAKKLIKDSDLGVVCLQPEIIKYAYPSKTMTYLEQGCPLFVIVEDGTELTRFVIDNKLGYTASPGNVDGIRESLLLAYTQHQKSSFNRERITQTYNTTFSEAIQLNYWSELYKELENE